MLINPRLNHNPHNLLQKISNQTKKMPKNINIANIQKSLNLSKFLILYPLFFTSSVFCTNIFPGFSLYASNKTQIFSSPKNTFSLLFLPISSTTFSLSIAYGGSISIWAPGIETDVHSSFHFLPDGNLRVNNGSGQIIWQSNTSHMGITHATLEDSGNLVLKNGSFSLWQSFDHFVDTLVPSQNFTFSKFLTSGFYSFGLNIDGNLTLKWNNSILYWNFGVKLNSSSTNNLKNPSLSLRENGILSISDPTLESSVILAYGSDFDQGNEFRFLRLDNDGNLRIYGVINGNVTSVLWTAISDQCEVFGYCGNMGVCSYNVTGSPVCSCPSINFELVNSSDSRKGCKRKVEIEDCPGNETMLQLDHTLFFTYYPETNFDVYTLGKLACRLNCLSGVCVASTILADEMGHCYIKPEDFVSAYMSPTISGTSFVKVCSPIEPNPGLTLLGLGGSSSKVQGWMIGGLASLGTLVGLFMLSSVIWWSCCRNNPKYGVISPQYALLEYASGTPVQFSYIDLKRATKGFKEKLGCGGFGAVYKGNLSNKMIVAVKQLEGIEQGEKQFRMEVATISSTHHLNLVRLIGFCSEGRHRLLVYEYMKNGSLDLFLFREEETSISLNWEQRFNIAIGTARGITYLHEECRDCIVHCDIKPENILLDENLIAKVSDFGLAKLMSQKDQKFRNLSSLRGTRGYLGREWLSNSLITSKSDVYSFGMVLLEIVSGRRNFEVSNDTNNKKFSFWAYEELEKGNVMSIVDKSLGEEFDMNQIVRALLVSFWCIQEQPHQRPMMGKLVQMLEGIIAIDKPPPLKANEEDLDDLSTSILVSSSISVSSSTQKSYVAGLDLERPSSSLLVQEGDN